MKREAQLLGWVKQQHKHQLIRRTTKPYLNHLTDVAELAAIIPLGYEIGLCHDLFEKAGVNKLQLQAALVGFGYNDTDANFISNCVTELTNQFTKEAYPKLSKKIRKMKEAGRLSKISSAAQTVKYADLIFNIGWMMKYDLKHAEKYLKKKKTLLLGMKTGDPLLLGKAIEIVDESINLFL